MPPDPGRLALRRTRQPKYRLRGTRGSPGATTKTSPVSLSHGAPIPRILGFSIVEPDMKNEITQKAGLPLLKIQAALVALGLMACNQALKAQTLEGQNKGDTNWIAGNLAGWAELEYIPMRVSFAAGSAGSSTVTITFPHFSGRIFGFENLTSFSAWTPNVQFTSPPTLVTGASGNWNYVFTVNIADNNPAEVRFLARLASGAHLYGGSSLQLKGSAGNVQFHKPSATPGAPNLALSISGPATVTEGGAISYTLNYTNKAAFDGASGVQITQLLPPEVTVDPATLPTNASLVGNSLFWDLGNVTPGASGQVTFTGTVALGTVAGSSLVNQAEIFSSENDLDETDNSVTLTTSVVCGGTIPTIVADPVAATVCPGTPATFSVSAVGPAGMTFQWMKDGSPIAGATSTNFTIASAFSTDAGSYSVAISSPCGSATSKSATLGFVPDGALLTSCAMQSDGSFLLNFRTGCAANYTVQSTQDFINWTTLPVTVPGNGATAQYIDPAPTALVSIPPTQNYRFYRVIPVR